MAWTYKQSTGEVFRPDGTLLVVGYSGKGVDKNDPTEDDNKGTGPIPRGIWNMTEVYNSKRVGPYAIKLEPTPETDLVDHGRGDFRIHGDSIKNPGTASSGCIIIPLWARKAMWQSQDHQLQVIA